MYGGYDENMKNGLEDWEFWLNFIEDGKEAVFDDNKIIEQEVVFVMDKFGYAKLIDQATFDRNREAVIKENKYYFNCMNTDKVCIFTDNGNMHQIKIIKMRLCRVGL